MQLIDASRLVLAGATLAILAAYSVPPFVPDTTKKVALLAYGVTLAVGVVVRAGWLDSGAIGIAGLAPLRGTGGVGVAVVEATDSPGDTDPVELVLFATTFAWLLLLVATEATKNPTPKPPH